MEDADLTRLAVAEIVREMQASGEERVHPLGERKLNPLGKPNKRFLGRTLNSMMTHNRREDMRTQESCRRKLKELDSRRRRRLREELYSRGRDINKDRQRSRSESSHKVYSSSSSTIEESIRKNRRKKRKKRCKRRNSNKETKQDDYDKEDYHYVKGFYQPEENEISDAIMATMAYNHINNFLHYQALMATTESAVAPEMCPISEVKSEIPARNEATSTTSSSILLTSSSSCSTDEIDENGMLTIQVSSDDNPKDKKIKRRRKQRRRLSSCSRISVSSSTSSCNEVTSMVSCISLDSAISRKPLGNSNSSIEILTYFSDVNNVENKSASESHENHLSDELEIEIRELSIDLTEE